LSDSLSYKKEAIPAKAGIQTLSLEKQGTKKYWIPVFTGMTDYYLTD